MNPETDPIRLMIADNHHLLRKGIGICLQVTGDIRVVGEASNGIEAVEQSRILKPDMILMDVLLPHMDGITATRLIHHENERIKILIFTILDDQALIKAALKAGAAGFLSKNISIQQLVEAIRKLWKTHYARH